MGSVQLREYERTASVVFLKTNESFGGLSNMAGGYPLNVQGVRIRTSEALYQACRFPHLPHVQRLIIEQASPMTAKMKSKPYREDSRPDWDEVRVKVMRWCLRVKLAQNWSTFSSLLLRSGNSPIVEESRRDDFWGAKRVGQHFLVGRNVLGRLLMELREVVKSSGRDAFLHVEPPAIPQFLLLGSPITVLAGRGAEILSSVEADGMQRERDSVSSREGEQASLLDQPVAKRAPQPTEVSAYAKHLQIGRIKAYPAMKDSGVKWVGDVPEHWYMKRLKTVVHLIDRKVEADEEYPVPYVGLENIESWVGRFLSINLGVVPAGTASEFKAGNTLFGKLRPYLAKACNPDFDGLCSTELLVLKGVEIDCRILLYLLLCDGFIRLVDSSTYGSKMPRASWDFIGSCVIPITPPNEQRSIADFLDRETAKIDTLVAKKHTLIERLKEKRTALISHTVIRGLPPDAAHAAGFDSHPKLKPSGIDWLGDVPEHWSVTRLRRHAQRLQTGSTPPTVEAKYYENGTVPWYGPGSFDNQIVLTRPVKMLHWLAVKKRAVRMFGSGATMVVTIGATLGKVSSLLQAGSCNQQITALEFDQRSVHPRFATYQIKRLENTLREIAPSATLPILVQGEMGNLPIVLPNLDEQRAIADFLDRQTAKLDALVTKIETAIERLQEYRTALITTAVTGKIDVRGTTSVSEPFVALPGITRNPDQ